MLAVLPTKNWGERRVNRSAPVTVLVSAEYHVNRPNRPPTAMDLLVLRSITALLLARNAVAIATIVVKMLACIVVNM